MNFKFEILFTVEFRHQYFDNGLFSGFVITPSDDTRELMKRYGLIYKSKAGGFLIGYDTSFAGSTRSREELLKAGEILSFRLNLVDLGLYNYSGLLPENISGAIFHFKNFSIPESPAEPVDELAGLVPRPSLVQDSFVSENDIDHRQSFNSKYFSKPFGQVSVFLHDELEKDFVVTFASKSTYWRYILVSEHLQELQKPAIINRSTQSLFLGPMAVKLPENREGIAFVSKEPIALTNMPNRMFSLLENYEEGNDRYRVIMSVLPNPDTRLVSEITNGEAVDSKKNYSNIIL